MMGMSRSRLESDTSDDVALHEKGGERVRGRAGGGSRGIAKGPGMRKEDSVADSPPCGRTTSLQDDGG